MTPEKSKQIRDKLGAAWRALEYAKTEFEKQKDNRSIGVYALQQGILAIYDEVEKTKEHVFIDSFTMTPIHITEDELRRVVNKMNEILIEDGSVSVQDFEDLLDLELGGINLDGIGWVLEDGFLETHVEAETLEGYKIISFDRDPVLLGYI